MPEVPPVMSATLFLRRMEIKAFSSLLLAFGWSGSCQYKVPKAEG
jgi:hypothetical protein